MKKSKIFRPIPLCVLLASCLGYSSAAPFPQEGRQTTWSQPGEQAVQLRVFGDEFYARTETEEGFTVVYDNAQGRYFYAALSADGNSLVPTASPLPGAAPTGLAKHLDLPSARIAEIASLESDRTDSGRRARWSKRVEAYQAKKIAATAGNLAAAQVQAAPILGNKNGLTILIQFPNDAQTSSVDPVNFPADRAKMERFCNGVGYAEDGNTGSIRDYFYDQSLGKLTYTQTVTNVVTMPKARNFYNFSDYPLNKVLRPDAGEGGRLLLQDALTILKAQNFNFTALSLDSNRKAIATNILFAGSDSGVFGKGLWPHAFALSSAVNVGTTALPINISQYQITDTEGGTLPIGTFCHENGHLLLDYPDIYGRSGEGVGQHCLMGSGNLLNRGRTPAPINLHFKELVGWTTIENLTTTASRVLALPTTGNVGYRIRKPGTSTESFVVENRGEGDKWAQFSDDKGIIIWHIDETIEGNYQIPLDSRYGIAVVQADGKKDLENDRNRGDSGDFFDLASAPLFSDTTNPNSNWFNDIKSSVTLRVLTGVGASTNVQFGALPSNSIAISSPNGSEVLYPVGNFDVRWDANIAGNVKIELFKNGTLVSTLAENTPNDGVFEWDISGSKQVGKGFVIRVKSLTNPIAVTDDSDSSFNITDQSFPDGNVLPSGWYKPKDAQSIWKVSKSAAFEGKTSLVSGKTADGKSSAIAYRSNFKAGTVTFYLKVSSERGYDYARFYIDGVAQIFANANSKPGITGDANWIFASFPLAAGNHTLKWTYEKDDSYGGLKDAAWLDGLALPQTTQEIAVLNPANENIENGQYTASFPSTPSGTSSTPVTFTIKNTGAASLLQLSVSVEGLNAADFKVSTLASTVVAAGKSTTFTVAFTPTSIDLRKATVVIRSNDETEDRFSIAVQGSGSGVPQIGLSVVEGKSLTTKGPAVNLGKVKVGAKGKTKVITILNTGNGDLKGLKISALGLNKRDFLVTAPGVSTLAPGETTSFQVTFRPTASGKRTAYFKVVSNDTKSGPFDLNVSGVATGKKKGKKIVASNLADMVLNSPTPALTVGSTSSVEVIGGAKFLALTLTKPTDGSPVGTVQVSPNLLDWFNGSQHTTIVIDDATTLKVRDNSPVTSDTKRYIRIK